MVRESKSKRYMTKDEIAYMDYTKCVSFLQMHSSPAGRSEGSQTRIDKEMSVRDKRRKISGL